MADRKDAMNEHEQRAVPAHVKKALDEWVAHYKELLAFQDTAQVRISHLQRQLADADAARRHAQAVSTKLVEDKRELEFKLKCLRSVYETMIVAYDNACLRAKEAEERARKAEAALADHLAEPRNMVPSETIATVTAWANETFGPATVFVQIHRAKQEFDELLAVLMGMNDDRRLAEEAADVCICLYRVIGTLDPEAINKKMAKNRARQWKIDGQGCAQHVGEE